MRRVICRLFAVEKRIAKDNGDESKDAANDYGEEHQTGLLNRELIHRPEGVWNSSEEAEQCSELGRNVKTDKSRDRFEEEHSDRTNEGGDSKGL